MSKSESLPINSAARNSTWVYNAYSPPRFDGAPAIVERTRSHRIPDFGELPESADIAVELYAGAPSKPPNVNDTLQPAPIITQTVAQVLDTSALGYVYV